MGGAPISQHIYGKAVDMIVGDLNKDGSANQQDKKLMMEIVDKKIIRSEGGVGFYPGTMTVHMDTRGFYARWDNFKRNP